MEANAAVNKAGRDEPEGLKYANVESAGTQTVAVERRCLICLPFHQTDCFFLFVVSVATPLGPPARFKNSDRSVAGIPD